MDSITVSNLGKAYLHYSTPWSRITEWLSPFDKKKHSLKWVLKSINFSVSAGEAVGIIGMNGAGKSTLLKLISGTTRPSTGTIELNGAVSALLELGLGFHPEFSGRQNCIVAAQLLGITENEVQQLLPEIIAFSELEECIDDPIRTYSTGMQVRLAFAVATAIRPEILIVDEALAVGDAYFQRKCFAKIKSFQDRGTTLLFVSHDPGSIRALCSKVIWLENGQMRKFGDVKGVLDEYTASTYAKEQMLVRTEPEKLIGSEFEYSTDKKRDCRLDFINHTNLRNDLEISDFYPQNMGWGDGTSKVTDVLLCDKNGRPANWIIGGENVSLVIKAKTMTTIENVAAGFQVRNKFGQILFGDNTFLTNIDNPLIFEKDRVFEAIFNFMMPILPQGLYSITAAVIYGSQKNHVVSSWMDDAVMFESHNGIAVSGLVGVPMINIEIK